MMFKRTSFGISKWILEHCLLMQLLIILCLADITKFLQELWVFSHVGGCVCILTLVIANTHGVETEVAHKCGQVVWGPAWCLSGALPCGQLKHCTQRSRLSRSCHFSLASASIDTVTADHPWSLHLHLCRKCSCHVSWNHVIQTWTDPNCWWWFWVAEIGCN